MRDPRLRSLLLVLALLGAPAVILRATCVGRSCPVEDTSSPRVPFCSLPGAFRDLVVAGFRDGRSPDVMAAAGGRGVTARPDEVTVSWPAQWSDTRVPLVFLGADVRAGPLPAGAGLDQVAPTLAELLGLVRPFPGVRAGTPLGSVVGGAPAPLVIEIVWKGVGSPDLGKSDGWPWLRHALDRGAATLEATTGSLPLDPAATMTTIGTGGLPSQHGITGSLLRADDGSVVGAWGPGAPISVIATLPDDLDERTGGAARIALVGTAEIDRGLTGGSWYVGGDTDDVRLGADPTKAVARLLRAGYGADRVPDIIAVALEGSVSLMDRQSAAIARALEAAVPGAVLVVAGTGSAATPVRSVRASDLAAAVQRAFPGAGPLVEALAGDGVFVNATEAADAGVGTDPLAQALARVRMGGDRVLADAYPAFSVSLSRYC